MTLRTRLGLAMATVSLVAAGGLFATAAVVIDRTYERGREIRNAAAVEAVEQSWSRAALSLDEKVRAIDESLAIRQVPLVGIPLMEAALGGDAESLYGLQSLVEAEAASRDLDVLDLVRADGTVIASAHDPSSRLSREDPAAAARAGETGPVRIQVAAVAAEGTSLARLAFASTRRLEKGPAGVTLTAGWFVDRPGRLKILSGAAELVRLEAAGVPPVVLGRDPFDPAPGEILRDDDPQTEVFVEHEAPLLPSFDDEPDAPARSAVLRIGGTDTGRETQRRLFRAFLAVAGLLVLGCFLAASLLSRRIAAPIDALAAGARALAQGDLDHRVARPRGRGSDEIGELVDAFNGMARDLKDSRVRLVQTERIAAWREIARQIAHEIKNPLTPIQLAVETTRRAHRAKRPDFDEIFEESAQAILEEVDSLKHLVKEFSEFARMPEPVLSTEDLEETVRGSLKLFTGLPATVTLETRLATSLPPVAHDRDQISRVIVNLVSNAVDALEGRPSGRVLVSMAAATTADGPAIELSIVDDGPGVPADHRATVFAPYFTTKTNGTGLGLAIVQRIVTDHGGEIRLEEAPGGGAAFRIRFRVVHGVTTHARGGGAPSRAAEAS